MDFQGAVRKQMEKKRAENLEILRLKYKGMSYCRSVNLYKSASYKRKKEKSKPQPEMGEE